MGIPFIWDALIFIGNSVVCIIERIEQTGKGGQNAYGRALESTDYVMDYHKASDFMEVTGRMMRYDAKKELWTLMEIKGVRGYFNDMRIDKGTIPEGFHFWELPVDCHECMEGFINQDTKWGFIGYGDLSLNEVVESVTI